MKTIIYLAFLGFGCLSCQNNHVLVFTKTADFRHDSIETGVEMVMQMAEENAFEVTHSEDATMFENDRLKTYDLIIFLNTSGDILNENQQEGFKSYIHNGGSFMGIHSATDTEHDWPWYGKLVGAYFVNHPEKSNAEMIIVDSMHQSTKHLSERWVQFDEWYNFKYTNPEINVLLKLDENTYEGGENGEYHPIAWCHDFEGGRAFYTGLGHTKTLYSEPLFRKHILGGINYCLKNK
ncbi:hypothetical protein OE09_0101 [Flavobacteriaceae bacterium MAR_2010_72]|nr:hypothetical protein OE09_0101 [Flavobacteriaceae bacterium MAR_2010_72]